MARKWDSGVFTAEQVRAWADAGEMGKVLDSVPVVTAWKAAMAKSAEGGYELRVPKHQPRNPKNKPDAIEAEALAKLKSENLDEYHVVDESMNADAVLPADPPHPGLPGLPWRAIATSLAALGQ
jgi:methyl-accepting chemotaxis protein